MWNYARQGILSIILNSVEFQIQTRTNHMIGEVPIFFRRRKIGTDHRTLESSRLNNTKHTIKIEEILWKSLDLYFLCEKFNTNEKHAAVVQLHCTIICVRIFFWIKLALYDKVIGLVTSRYGNHLLLSLFPSYKLIYFIDYWYSIFI